VSDIYVAMRKNEMEGFRKQIKEEKLSKPVHVVEGGESRQQSVANALAEVGKTKPSPDDVVLVHDAVRPFVDTDIINAVIEEASLAERAGNEVAVVMGSARNIKITTPDDMELAEFFLSQDRRRSNLAG